MSGTVNIPRTIWKDPAFKPQPFTEREAYMWLADKGRIVQATVSDLSREWFCADRRAVQILGRLERSDVISVQGSGAKRTIFVTSKLVASCGLYRCREARQSNAKGAYKWRGASISQKMRKAIIDRDGRNCAYCGAFCQTPHIDHIIPVAKGGKDHPKNLTVSCPSCNLSKGAKSLEEWIGPQ